MSRAPNNVMVCDYGQTGILHAVAGEPGPQQHNGLPNVSRKHSWILEAVLHAVPETFAAVIRRTE